MNTSYILKEIAFVVIDLLWLIFLVAFFFLSSCAPVRFATEQEKTKDINELRARIGLPPQKEDNQ